MKKQKMNLTKQWIKIITGPLVLYSLIRISLWSYSQSEEFLRIFNSVGESGLTTSHLFSIIVQYGQNIAIWLGLRARKEARIVAGKISSFEKQKRSSSGSDKERLEKLIFKYGEIHNSKIMEMRIWLGGYLSMLFVDGLTNIGQFLLAFSETSARILENTLGHTNTTALLAKTMGVVAVTIVIFVEEAVPGVLTALGSSINDVLEYYGKKRYDSWDSFREEFIEESIKNSKSVSGNKNKGRAKNRSARNQSNSPDRNSNKLPKSYRAVPKSQIQYRPTGDTQRASETIPPYTPVYHPVGTNSRNNNEVQKF